jgi:hypothetical protein
MDCSNNSSFFEQWQVLILEIEPDKKHGQRDDKGDRVARAEPAPGLGIQGALNGQVGLDRRGARMRNGPLDPAAKTQRPAATYLE